MATKQAPQVSDKDLPDWYKNRSNPLRKLVWRAKGGLTVTWTIMALMILGMVTLYVTMTSFDSASISFITAWLSASPLAGQWWGLFTTQLMSGNLIQLILNLLFIWYLGQWLEPTLGHFRYLMAVLFAGGGGNLLVTYLTTKGLPIGVMPGMTTAIFGLLMVVLVDAFVLKYGITDSAGRYAITLILLNLVMGLFFSGLIGILSQLSGLVAGFIAGLLWPPLRARTRQNRMTTLIGTVIGAVIMIGGYLLVLP